MAEEEVEALGGLFSFESMYVQFGFTHARFVAAVTEFAGRTGPAPIPEEIRTYIHELTHCLQAATTPYGLFLHYCRVMQTTATVELVKLLLQHGIEPRQPLLNNVPDVPDYVGQRLRDRLGLWLNAEKLIADLEQNPEKLVWLFERFVKAPERASASGKPSYPDLLGVTEAFYRIQAYIAMFIEKENEIRHSNGLPPWDQGEFDREAILSPKVFPPEDERSVERRRMDGMEEALNLLNHPIGAEAIIESAATAAEFTRDGIDLPTFRAWADSPCAPELALYRRCLQLGLKAIPATDVPQFVFSYLALCELALFAPLLPQHASLRVSPPKADEILPSWRWFLLLGAAKKVAPLQGLRDHARYVTELCQQLGWVHPVQIVAATVRGPHSVSDPRAQVYVNAQLMRARGSWAFLDAARIILDNSPSGVALRDNCTFVIVQHSDKTLYHRNKDYLEAMTRQHLQMLVMRHIMLGKALRIRSPYRCDAAEKRALTTWLQESLEATFHRRFPMAEVV
jgi:hypothetical protein